MTHTFPCCLLAALRLAAAVLLTMFVSTFAEAGEAGGPEGGPLPTELVGMVVDADGRPLAGVKVDVWHWCPGNETVTDEGGRFRLGGFEPGEALEVLVRGEGFSPAHFVAQPAGTPDWRVVLKNDTWLEGRVTGPDGRPVAGAEVEANRGPFRNPSVTITELTTTTMTDADGTYRLRVEEASYDVQVRVAGVGATRVPEVTVGPGEQRRLDLALERGVTLRATVRNSVTGEPVAGIKLLEGRKPGLSGVSDGEGVLEIAELPEGKISLHVINDGDRRAYRGTAGEWARWWSPQAAAAHQREEPGEGDRFQRNLDRLTFDLAGDTLEVDLYVEPAVRLRGRVLDPEGNPVAGATVAPANGRGNSLTGDTRYSFETDADGAFTMWLPASKDPGYNLIAHDGGYREWRNWANGVLPPMTTAPGDRVDGLELRLTRPGSVSGRLVDEAGAPIAGADVDVVAADARDNRYYVPTTKTDADGRYEVRYVAPGEQVVRTPPFTMDPRQAESGTVRRVTLDPGEQVEGVDLVRDEPTGHGPLPGSRR